MEENGGNWRVSFRIDFLFPTTNIVKAHRELEKVSNYHVLDRLLSFAHRPLHLHLKSYFFRISRSFFRPNPTGVVSQPQGHAVVKLPAQNTQRCGKHGKEQSSFVLLVSEL